MVGFYKSDSQVSHGTKAFGAGGGGVGVQKIKCKICILKNILGIVISEIWNHE